MQWRENAPKRKIFNFQLPSLAQEHLCLSFLIFKSAPFIITVNGFCELISGNYISGIPCTHAVGLSQHHFATIWNWHLLSLNFVVMTALNCSMEGAQLLPCWLNFLGQDYLSCYRQGATLCLWSWHTPICQATSQVSLYPLRWAFMIFLSRNLFNEQIMLSAW